MKRGEKNSKRVIITDADGKEFAFPSAAKASNEIGFNDVVLRRYCRENKTMKSGKHKGWNFRYEKIEFLGDEGERGSPPMTIGDLIDDLKIYPKTFALEIDVDVNFDLITRQVDSSMKIQPSSRLRKLLKESEIDDQSSSNQEDQ